MYGLHDFVSCMLEAGANPSLTSEDCGSAPVLQAAYYGHHKVLKVLIEHKLVLADSLNYLLTLWLQLLPKIL